MSALVNALDNNTSQQIGQNGHVEYGWSNSLQEKIVQFSFQLTRNDENGKANLCKILYDMLNLLKHHLEHGSLPERDFAKVYLSILYKMIGYTRDIIDGKGEYTLTYMMIFTWYHFFPELAKFALKCIVNLDNNIHQYGSWKDIKYFCGFCKAHADEMDHPLILEAIRITNEQLRKDFLNDAAGTGPISLVAKWIPREKSTFGWLYQSLATDYFCEYMVTATSEQKNVKAVLKCKTEYRKLISYLNKKIDTLQVKQCANNWSKIDFNKVTSISLGKQKKAFLNIDKKGNVRYADREDRIECRENFATHVTKAVNGEVVMKGKRVAMADFTRQARQLYRNNGSQVEKELLNSQWTDNSSQNCALENMIPMVDLSSSMYGDPMDVAIAMGIRIAEKSKIGKRIMTFSLNPKWINLESHDDFISQVQEVESGDIGYNTDFHKAFNLILDSIITNKMMPEDVENMVLIILSDMQIDEADPTKRNREALYETIKQKYADAGLRVHGRPYKPPHILFWNLRNTNGFPCLSTEKNTSMLSGFNPALLNQFCDNGLHALQSCTPWSILLQSLDNQRYKIMRDYLEIQIHF